MTVPGLQGWRITPARSLRGDTVPVKVGSIITQANERLIVMQIDEGEIATLLGLQSAGEVVANLRKQMELKNEHDMGRS